MAIVWDDKLKRNLLDIGSALNPRWGRALSAGVDLFENMFLDTDTGSGGQINTGCSKKWFQRFRKDPSGIHLVIGKQRGGKSALCFFLAQATLRRPIYAITAADEVLPEVEVIEDILQVPRGGVCVIDDAQLFFNSMRTGDDDYMKLRNLANIIEKSNICLIFNAHSTTLLNKTPTESTRTLIFKELGYIRPYAAIAYAFLFFISCNEKYNSNFTHIVPLDKTHFSSSSVKYKIS
jgi:hypothetical protein